jgi:hypothetical protein
MLKERSSWGLPRVSSNSCRASAVLSASLLFSRLGNAAVNIARMATGAARAKHSLMCLSAPRAGACGQLPHYNALVVCPSWGGKPLTCQCTRWVPDSLPGRRRRPLVATATPTFALFVLRQVCLGWHQVARQISDAFDLSAGGTFWIPQ